MKNSKKKSNPAPITAPNSSLDNKTGPWRTQKPVIDYKKCISCGLCAKICPEGCIEMTGKNKKIPVIDYDYCKGCGLCVAECPVKAIAVKKDF